MEFLTTSNAVETMSEALAGSVLGLELKLQISYETRKT